MAGAERITIVEAARRAKVGYLTIWNALLRGELRGERTERGRWLVDARDFVNWKRMGRLREAVIRTAARRVCYRICYHGKIARGTQCARRDSNPRPSAPEAASAGEHQRRPLSSQALGARDRRPAPARNAPVVTKSVTTAPFAPRHRRPAGR